MDDRTLADRLERDDATPTVAAFPDGSVDRFYEVSVGGERVATRSAFADCIAAERADAFALRRETVEPGGHAVNFATQANHLGDDVTLAGHLDDRVFADLPFDAVSMGEPSTVSVYGFDDGDVLAVENSTALETWTLGDLRAALGDGFEQFLGADVVCCANWTSVDGLPTALSSLAATDTDGGWFLVDPGSVVGREAADFERFFDALERLAGAYEVVLAGNPREIDALAGGVGNSADEGGESTADADAQLEAIRGRTGIAGVVVHGEARAAVATDEGVAAERNFDVDPTRHTGGGDRFDAGLAHALARGWGWSDALLLGNACASRYVATGETGTRADVAAFLRGHHA